MNGRRHAQTIVLSILLFLAGAVNIYLMSAMDRQFPTASPFSRIDRGSGSRGSTTKKQPRQQQQKKKGKKKKQKSQSRRPARPDSGLEFVHITKTAGTSIEATGAKHGVRWGVCHFKKVKGFPGCAWPDIKLGRQSEWYNRSRLPLQQQIFAEPWHTPHHWFRKNIYGGKATFAVVRNPYHRILSEYHCKYGGYRGEDRHRAPVMNRFLRQMVDRSKKVLVSHYMPQHWYVYDATGRRRIDRVLRFETLDRDFPRLAAAFNLTMALPARKNARKNARLTVANLTRATLRAIGTRYAEDFRRFGYQVVHSAEEFGEA